MKHALLISEIEEADYRIYNLLGQDVGRGKIENNSIFISNLQSGTYLLEVNSKGNSAVKKFIKQ